MIRQRTSSLMNRRNQTKLDGCGQSPRMRTVEEKRSMNQTERKAFRVCALEWKEFSLLTSHWGNVRNDLRTSCIASDVLHYIWTTIPIYHSWLWTRKFKPDYFVSVQREEFFQEDCQQTTTVSTDTQCATKKKTLNQTSCIKVQPSHLQLCEVSSE